jgi:hypothetical protein
MECYCVMLTFNFTASRKENETSYTKEKEEQKIDC